MKTCDSIALTLLALLAMGVAQAQDNADPSESGTTTHTACLVDDRLAAWLSLEAADRMVASLESEFRELTATLAKHSATLEQMDEGTLAGKGVVLTKTGVPRRIEPGSREVLEENCNRIENRLTEVRKTLKRRRLQRARLEEWVNVYLGISVTDGS